MTFEYLILSERQNGNAVGRNLDADRKNQTGKLLYSFTCVSYGYLSMS